MYETRVTFRYPKGRAHDETLRTWDPLDVGSEFCRFGHTWKVVGTTSTRSRYDRAKTRLVCERSEDVHVAA
jgi:hypothetical protein